MKRYNIFALMMTCILSLAALTSCTPDSLEGIQNVTFPEYKEYVVEAGDEVTIAFTAEADWEIAVPDNMLQWFWIQDGSFQVYKLGGKAGGHEVTIKVSDTPEFEVERTCEVTMTYGTKKQVVAKLIRSSVSKQISVSAAKVVDGEIQFTPDGSSYDYMDGEPEMMELIWGGSDYRLPIKVTSNFDWTYEGPEWLQIDVPEKGRGVHEVKLYGVPSKYPLEDATGSLKFKSDDQVLKEYDVKISGCSDIFSYTMDMALTELIFNYRGEFKVATGFIEGPASGSILGTSAARVVVLSKNQSEYSAEVPAWLSVNVMDYDATEGAPVLQERDITFSAEHNEGENRYAAIFFLPPSVDAEPSALYEGSEIKEEYKQYMIPVTQLSSDQEFVSMLANPSEIAAGGASFNVTDDKSLFTKFGQTKYAYDLIYTNQYAKDNARMVFTSNITSYKVYDANGADKTSDETFFLSFKADDENLGGVVNMVSEGKAVGYVVFYGSESNVLAVIRCTFDPDVVIGEVANVEFIGESAMYAPMVGATLEDVSDDKSFSQYWDGEALVYHLRYTTENMPMTISIPASVKKHTVNPYALRYNFSVNETKYDETFVNGILGGVALIDGGVTIYMTMPEGKQYLRGNIIFTDEENTSILVLVCTMDLRETE